MKRKRTVHDILAAVLLVCATVLASILLADVRGGTLRHGAPDVVDVTPLPARPFERDELADARSLGEGRQVVLVPTAAPAELERTTVLHFRTSTWGEFETKPAPDVDFEFGFGDGAVVDGDPAGHGRSDSAGNAEVEWDDRSWREAVARERWIWARVVGADASNTEQWFPLRAEIDRRWFEIFVGRGHTLRGIVLDPAGNGVEAQIQLALAEYLRPSRFARSVRSRADGTFAIATFGEPFVEIVARAESVGVGSRSFADIARQIEPIVIRLAGPGVVRGVVRDRTGRSVPGLPVRVTTAKLSAQEAYENRPESSTHFDRDSAIHEAEIEGGGLVYVWSRTDADGRFEVRGLRSDSFVMHGPGLWFPLPLPGPALTPEPVLSDGKHLELVSDAVVLRIRVENPDGSPWEPALAGKPEADPTAGVIAIPVLEPWAASLFHPHAIPCTDLGGGVFTLVRAWGEQFRRYRVGVRGRGLFWSTLEVVAPADVGVIDVRLGAGPRKPDGTLALTLRPASPVDPSATVVMRVQDLITRAPITEARTLRLSDGATFHTALPAGVYALALDAGPIQRERGSGFASVVEQPIWIRSGEERVLSVTIPTGARIVVDVTNLESPPLAVGATAPLRYQTSLRIEREGRLTKDVLYPQLDPANGRVLDWILWDPQLGARVSGPLPTGVCTIVVVLKDGRTGRARIELVDGETTTVALRVE